EKDLIVAEQFEILQTGATTQRQVGQGEHVIGFMIGQVELQHWQALVQGIDQTGLPDQRMDSADAADADATTASADLIMDIAGGHDRLVTTPQVELIQATLDAALAVGQFLMYARFHSKSLRAFGVGENRY